jgi:sec-independent protein translocase protein TatA
MGRIGFGELLLIAAVILLLFGARRLPEIGAAIGKAMREFNAAFKGTSKENEDADGKK